MVSTHFWIKVQKSHLVLEISTHLGCEHMHTTLTIYNHTTDFSSCRINNYSYTGSLFYLAYITCHCLPVNLANSPHYHLYYHREVFLYMALSQSPTAQQKQRPHPVCLVTNHGFIRLNSQNNRYWSQESPVIIHKVPLHDLKVGVQYNVTATKITGPISFSGS